MANTHYEIGGVPLEYCEWTWTLFRGAAPQTVEIPQRAARFDALKALPYITELTVGSSYGDGVNPPEMPVTIRNVRLVEVQRRGDLGCALILSDCRWDLRNVVCPVDFNLRFRDGYLNGTAVNSLAGALQKLADNLPVLAENLAPDAYDAIASITDKVPDGIVLSGMVLPQALDKLLSLMGADLTVGADGLIRYVSRGDLSAQVLPGATTYKWMLGGVPTWLSAERAINGLPRKVVVHYRERHALRLEFVNPDSRSTAAWSILPELRISLYQRYFFRDKYYTLSGLLRALDLPTDAITDEQIARVVFSANFEGTQLERYAGSLAAQTAIRVIKECWRRCLFMAFDTDVGRMGAWSDIIGGKIRTAADKDASGEPAGDIDQHAVEAPWVEFFAGAIAEYTGEQRSILRAVVATSHEEVPAGNTLPNAPFLATVDEAAGVIRLTPAPELPEGNEAHLGRFEPDAEIRVVPTDVVTNDQGQTEKAEFNYRWPSPERLALRKSFQAFVFVVASRRLPNNYDKWTRIEIDGVESGDVAEAHLEVGDELWALRDYVGGDKPVEGDGLGKLLNRATLEADAQRRAASYLRETTAAIEGRALALGTPMFAELFPVGPIKTVALEVNGLRVRSHIEAGNLGDVQARARTSQAREARNVIISGERKAV